VYQGSESYLNDIDNALSIYSMGDGPSETILEICIQETCV